MTVSNIQHVHVPLVHVGYDSWEAEGGGTFTAHFLFLGGGGGGRRTDTPITSGFIQGMRSIRPPRNGGAPLESMVCKLKCFSQSSEDGERGGGK